jgi:hypothetical protein
MYNNPDLNIQFKQHRPALINKGVLEESIWVQKDPHSHQHLIEKGNKVPCKIRLIIFPYEQNKLIFNYVFHQKSLKGSGLGRILGEAEVSGFPPSKKGEPPIGLTIIIDSEGNMLLEADLANDIIILGNGDFRETYLTIKNDESGEEFFFKAFDEMPPEMKNIYHEQFERLMCNLDSESSGQGFKEFAQGASRFPYKLRFIANGKEYDRAQDIPDEEKRKKAEEYEDHIYHPEKYFKYKRFEVICPGCNELIIPKRSFFAGFKCPLCKHNIPTDLIRDFLV